MELLADFIRIQIHLNASVAEPAVGKGAGPTLQAEPAIAEGGDIVSCDGNPRNETGQQNVENRPVLIHDTSR